MLSIVCVYNNPQILNDFLLKSLKGQTREFELIEIDNTREIYKSAAQALNQGGKKAQGEYIMFVHQDVDLSSNSWIEDAERILNTIPDLGIAGVAGVSEEGRTHKDKKRNIIKHGIPPEDVVATPIHRPDEVQTLDECLIIIPKSVFNRLQFDERTCNDWHLYAADYCLSIKKIGYSAYAIPMFIYHRSKGDSMSLGYYRTLNRLLKKYRKDVKCIYKPGKAWSTLWPLILQRILLWLKEFLRVFLIAIGVRYLWRKSGLKSLLKRE
jgi:hypothetical protein